MKLKKGTLYGGGMPPFSWYIDYLGKPLYKTSRKLGIPKIGALAVANIPGSLFHVNGFLRMRNFDDAALWFTVSEVICVGLFYGIHKGYGLGRKLKLEDNASKNTIDDLVKDNTVDA